MADFPNSTAAPINCPVEKIAHEAAEVVALERMLDSRRGPSDEEHDSLALVRELRDRADAHLSDRRRALEALACAMPARSLPGAFFQLLLIPHIVEEIRNEEAMSEPVERRLSRLIHSIANALERTTGFDRATLCGDYWLDPRYDPFALMETAVAPHVA